MRQNSRGKRIRFVMLSAVAIFLAAPVPRVFTATTPIVRTSEVVGNNMRKVHGVAAPGLAVSLQFRQRNFKEDDRDFDFCGWLAGGVWRNLGTATTGSDGKWTVDITRGGFPTGVSVKPVSVVEQNCSGGLYTELQVVSTAGVRTDAQAPLLSMLNVPSRDASRGNGNQRWVEADVARADTIAAAISDGPDMPGTEHPGSDDIDEDGIDVCKVYEDLTGCGTPIEFRRVGGDLVAPNIQEDFETGGSVLDPISDPEFDFITGMVQAHAPSRSFIAIATLPRLEEAETSFNINVNINGLPNISCGGNPFFSFLKVS